MSKNNQYNPPLLAQPFDKDEPVFDEPWHAQAFSITIQLAELGIFTWKEWTQVISEEIIRAQEKGDLDMGNTYYNHWLNALEHLLREKGITTNEELYNQKIAWRKAYINTAHGQQVSLNKENVNLGNK